MENPEDGSRGSAPTVAGSTATYYTLAERRQRELELYVYSRLSGPEIARRFNLGSRTVYADLEMLGLRRRPRGGRHESKLSLIRAAREYGLDPGTLRLAIDAKIIRAERIERVGLGRDGVGFLLDEHELLEDLEALPRCGYFGCDRHALGPSGGCHKHGAALITQGWPGRPRPDQRRRMAWAVRGAAVTTLFEVARSAPPRWRGGWPGSRTRQKWGQVWGGNTPPRAGASRGAPRKYDFRDESGNVSRKRSRDDVLREVRKACIGNPRLGLRPVAQRAGITKAQLEYLLTEEGCRLADLRRPVS